LLVEQITPHSKVERVLINLDHVWLVTPSKARFWTNGQLDEHETTMFWIDQNFTDAEGDCIEVDEPFNKIAGRIYEKTEKKRS